MESLHRLAGTSQDPFKQLMIEEFVEDVSKMPGIGCGWFDHISRLFVQDDDAFAVHEKMAMN